MKKIRFMFLGGITVITLSTSIGATLVSAATTPTKTAVITKESVSPIQIGSVRLGETESDVQKHFGNPSSINTNAKTHLTDWSYNKYPYLRILFSDKKVVRVDSEGTKSPKTPCGIGYGSTLTEVEHCYNQYHYTISRSKVAIGYTVYYKNEVMYFSLSKPAPSKADIVATYGIGYKKFL